MFLICWIPFASVNLYVTHHTYDETTVAQEQYSSLEDATTENYYNTEASVINSTNSDGSTNSEDYTTMEYVQSLTESLNILSVAINPWMYSLLNRTFRKTLAFQLKAVNRRLDCHRRCNILGRSVGGRSTATVRAGTIEVDSKASNVKSSRMDGQKDRIIVSSVIMGNHENIRTKKCDP